MSEHKVPQDVEADDKLIGPFSFRQFIYLIVAAIAGFLAWALAQIFIALVILPIPIVIFFLILALPLRKDQPMEAYLLAMVQFYMKPNNRYWTPDGELNLVEVTAPKTIEAKLTKDFTSEQASAQLSYLADVIDTGGWASRGVNPAMTEDATMQVNQAEDVLDDNSGVGQSFDTLLATSNTTRKQAMLEKMRSGAEPTQASPTPTPATSAPTTSATAVANPDNMPTNSLKFNPYPDSMRQHVIDPSGQSTPQPAPEQSNSPTAQPETPTTPTPQPEQPTTPSKPTVSPDILRLASNDDLSISAIANEAHRHDDDEEVVVNLH